MKKKKLHTIRVFFKKGTHFRLFKFDLCDLCVLGG